MTVQQVDWVHKVAVVVIAGVALFMVQAMWGEIRVVEEDLSEHEIEAARTYVPRIELVRAVTRLEDAMREAIRDAKNSDR